MPDAQLYDLANLARHFARIDDFELLTEQIEAAPLPVPAPRLGGASAVRERGASATETCGKNCAGAGERDLATDAAARYAAPRPAAAAGAADTSFALGMILVSCLHIARCAT